MKSAYDIYIVGLGIQSTIHVTRETEQTLSMCKVVHYLHTDPEVVEPYLLRHCAKVSNLQECYSESVPRFKAYETMVNRVVSSAEQSAPVALALYGSPVVFVSPSREIVERAGSLGMNVKVLPGISAMECMFVDLGIDPCEGCLTYEVNDILLHNRPLVPQLHTFIWQIGGVESELFVTAPSTVGRFHRIRDYLLKSYRANHPAKIVSCATLPVVDAKVIDATVGTLPDFHHDLHAGVTLYLPPDCSDTSLDEEYMALLHDESHLSNITERHTGIE